MMLKLPLSGFAPSPSRGDNTFAAGRPLLDVPYRDHVAFISSAQKH